MKRSLSLFWDPRDKRKIRTDIQSITNITTLECNNALTTAKNNNIAILCNFYVSYITFPTATEGSSLSLKHDLHDQL